MKHLTRSRKSVRITNHLSFSIFVFKVYHPGISFNWCLFFRVSELYSWTIILEKYIFHWSMSENVQDIIWNKEKKRNLIKINKTGEQKREYRFFFISIIYARTKVLVFILRHYYTVSTIAPFFKCLSIRLAFKLNIFNLLFSSFLSYIQKVNVAEFMIYTQRQRQLENKTSR